jgi:S-(hydroxymethyl)glutathione dehydrogenase/alcohol dehydrogenase
MPMLYEKIENGEFDPREIISHIVPLEDAADAYQIFNDHMDDCTKVILKP